MEFVVIQAECRELGGWKSRICAGERRGLDTTGDLCMLAGRCGSATKFTLRLRLLHLRHRPPLSTAFTAKWKIPDSGPEERRKGKDRIKGAIRGARARDTDTISPDRGPAQSSEHSNAHARMSIWRVPGRSMQRGSLQTQMKKECRGCPATFDLGDIDRVLSKYTI